MTRKEVLEIIAAHPYKPLYVEHGNSFMTLFERISKTNATKGKVAKLFTKVEVGPYISFRPDLNPKRIVGGDDPIVLFRTEIAK